MNEYIKNFVDELSPEERIIFNARNCEIENRISYHTISKQLGASEQELQGIALRLYKKALKIPLNEEERISAAKLCITSIVVEDVVEEFEEEEDKTSDPVLMKKFKDSRKQLHIFMKSIGIKTIYKYGEVILVK